MTDQGVPTDPTDAVLEVLRDAIGTTDISPADDFYFVGGHSLLIVRVIQRLRRQYGLELSPRQFGANSQIAALIAACRPVVPRESPDGG
ncbi:acyl carrier protein [Longispora urticae]